MNRNSLNIIEDCISTCGKWVNIEVVSDSIYVEFKQVQLFNNNPNLKENYTYDSNLAIRFAENSFFSILYNNEEDISFLDEIKTYDSSFSISFEKNIKEDNFKFQNIDYLNSIIDDYEHETIFIENYKNNLENSGPDFILTFISDDIVICVGGNRLHIFNDIESLDDNEVLKLSNKWAKYYLKYWQLKGSPEELDYDPVCEVNPINLPKPKKKIL